jgi:hypothetical protein
LISFASIKSTGRDGMGEENKMKERGGITFCFPFSLLLSKETLPDFFLLTPEFEIKLRFSFVCR